MKNNFRFWIFTALTVALYSLAFSVITTGFFHTILLTLGSLTLIMATYLLGKIKILELIDMLKYFIYKIKGGKE